MESDSRKLAEKIVEYALEKKGQDVTLIKMDEKTIICDYFVIVTGSSRTHNKAIAEHIAQALKDEGMNERKYQGKDDGGWILLDYGSVVVHVFLENLREFYNLEKLWKDGEIVYVTEPDMEMSAQ
ncbi:MAG: ribosome silencing factor [Vulcanimicrobiota bacterium]